MSGPCHKHFLKLLDLTPAELNSLLQLAAKLRADRKSGKEEAKFAGKNIVLTFKEDLTHIRYSFEVATYDQGARVTYLGPSGSQAGYKESIKDTAHVLDRMYDGIQYRDYGQEIVEALAGYAGVPVWSGLINELHPTQLLADLLAMQEYLPGKVFNEMVLVYAGDARNNMGNLMFEATTLAGLDLCLVTPQAYWPEAAPIAECSALARKHGGKITLTEGIAFGVKGTDLIYTDAWVPMGGPKEKQAERIALLRDYQVNSRMMALTDNPQVRFLHCLPTSHDEQITLDKRMATELGLYGGMEVTDKILEFLASIAFDQTENRMHTIRAVMVATLAK